MLKKLNARNIFNLKSLTIAIQQKTNYLTVTKDLLNYKKSCQIVLPERRSHSAYHINYLERE